MATLNWYLLAQSTQGFTADWSSGRTPTNWRSSNMVVNGSVMSLIFMWKGSSSFILIQRQWAVLGKKSIVPSVFFSVFVGTIPGVGKMQGCDFFSVIVCFQAFYWIKLFRASLRDSLVNLPYSLLHKGHQWRQREVLIKFGTFPLLGPCSIPSHRNVWTVSDQLYHDSMLLF